MFCLVLVLVMTVGLGNGDSGHERGESESSRLHGELTGRYLVEMAGKWCTGSKLVKIARDSGADANSDWQYGGFDEKKVVRSGISKGK
jgi:hypothetical protein